MSLNRLDLHIRHRHKFHWKSINIKCLENDEKSDWKFFCAEKYFCNRNVRSKARLTKHLNELGAELVFDCKCAFLYIETETETNWNCSSRLSKRWKNWQSNFAKQINDWKIKIFYVNYEKFVSQISFYGSSCCWCWIGLALAVGTRITVNTFTNCSIEKS